MRGIVHSTLVFALVSCGRAPTAVSEPAAADVSGHVLTSAGAPLAAASVSILCAGSSGVSVTTDANGAYGTELTAPAAASGTRVNCTFRVGDASAPRVRTDAAVWFGTSGLPHPLQLIDLREGS